MERTLFSVWMPPSNMVKSRVFQLRLQHMVWGAALSSWIFSPKTATLGDAGAVRADTRRWVTATAAAETTETAALGPRYPERRLTLLVMASGS